MQGDFTGPLWEIRSSQMMGIDLTWHRSREARAFWGKSMQWLVSPERYGSLVTSERLRNRGSGRKEEWYTQDWGEQEETKKGKQNNHKSEWGHQVARIWLSSIFLCSSENPTKLCFSLCICNMRGQFSSYLRGLLEDSWRIPVNSLASTWWAPVETEQSS